MSGVLLSGGQVQDEMLLDAQPRLEMRLQGSKLEDFRSEIDNEGQIFYAGFDDVWAAMEKYDRAEFEVSIVNRG